MSLEEFNEEEKVQLNNDLGAPTDDTKEDKPPETEGDYKNVFDLKDNESTPFLPEDNVKPTEKDPNKTGGFYPGSNYALGNLENTMQALSAPGLGLADFVMDAAGTVIPGAGKLDDAWDKATKLPKDQHQAIRKFASIVIPSLMGGGLAAQGAKNLPAQMPRIQKALVTAGIFSAVDAAIIGLSDVGEDHNLMRALADFVPGLFGPKGAVPIPEAIVTLDEDSGPIRKRKNMYDSAFLTILSSLIGGTITLLKGSKKMDWFQPLDQNAMRYKADQVVKTADTDTLIKIQEIQTELANPGISEQVRAQLIDEATTLEQTLEITGSLEDALRQLEARQVEEQNIAAINKIQTDPEQVKTDFDPDVTPGVVKGSSNARQSIPPGNVARNMADTTAIKTGISEGDPAPIITESMRSKGLMVGSTSRDAVMGVAEEARDIGRFDALVDGFRFTTKQMNAAAWDIYTSIIAAENMDDVRGLFIDNKALQPMLLGKFNVEYINEEQARAAAFALRDLTDRYLGRATAQSSARVMDTLGREASTIAEAVQELSPVIDENRAMDLIIDKMQFLLDEYALNKYISGWQLRNKNWFDQVPPKELDSVLETLQKEFKSAENAIHAKNLRFTKEIKELAETNPLAVRPLVDAFAHTNGDVDSLAKLMKWAADQVTPMGLLKSPDPKALNLFTRQAWGVIYNNVLSGISALKAVVGNTGQIVLRPITSVLGHGIWGPADAFEGFKRTFYLNGAMYETNRRALKDAWTMTKKAHKDPELMMKAYRKDFVFQEDKAWDILEEMRPLWEKEGNYGRTIQYDMAKLMKQLALLPGLRYGMTGMVFPDVFAQTHVSHWLTRMRAYDDVFTEFGYADPTKILLAEKEHAAKMFTKDGIMQDEALKALSGEISLNLDDGVATWINKATTAYPITKHAFMFPRTASNTVRNALSWTPISAIPGINKYSKTIWARTDDDIAAALAEHGIDMATTPNARVLWQNLRAEYTGRVAFSSILAGTLWQYAMAGNIRGNGHYNAGIRQKERDQLGYIPKTINLGGRWVSYKGIMGVDQVLSIIGDMAYYASDIDQAFLEDWQAKLMWTISAGFLNETPLQSFEPLVAAASGDLTAWSRFGANTLRSWIPLSGALGVLSNAITSSQKDIHGEMLSYLMNRMPGFSSLLPEQIDIWTGQPLNDIDNPWLRMLNAVSPLKVSGTREPWRVWLESTGWDGMSRLRKDSSGSYEYSKEEKEIIYKYIGEQQMFKKIERLMKSKRYNEELNKLRAHRATGDDLGNERIRLETQKLPVIQEINNIVRNAQKVAELRLLNEAKTNPDLKHIPNAILYQQLADERMKAGDVEGAGNLQKKEKETRQLLQMAK